MNKPIYEVVKVLKNKVFIVGFGWKDDRQLISDNLESVYEELSKIHPNKTIIFTDDIGEETFWRTLFETKFESNESPTGYGLTFCDYNGKLPRIKGWDKICPNHIFNLLRLQRRKRRQYLQKLRFGNTNRSSLSRSVKNLKKIPS